jgi:hypothetical protein
VRRRQFRERGRGKLGVVDGNMNVLSTLYILSLVKVFLD